MHAERFAIAVDLTIGTDVFPIVGGNVLRLDLLANDYSVQGTLEFVAYDDKSSPDTLPEPFLSAEPSDVKITVEPNAPQFDEEPVPLVVTALVTERRMVERSYAWVQGEPVLVRRYIVEFADAAQVLWRQHFPLALRADVSWTEVLSEHAVEGITLENKLAASKQTRGVVCLPLRPEGGMDFYSFAAWFVAEQGGYWTYDADKAVHRWTDARPSVGSPALLRDTDVEGLELRWPAANRAAPRVRNVSTLATDTRDVASELALDGVYADRAMCTPQSADVDDAVELAERTLRPRKPQLHMNLAVFPCVPLAPGRGLKLASTRFSAELAAANTTWRVSSLHLSLRCDFDDLEVDRDTPARAFDTELRVVCDRADDAYAHLPAFSNPPYPIEVEGKIISPGNEAGDRWYAVHEDDDTGEIYYNVTIPLWNQDVRVPFEPGFFPGHVYAPTYKDARLLLSVWHGGVQLERMLDWGTDAKLPLDSQGNHVLFGKNATSQTELRHDYVDDKPVLTLNRSSVGDLELMEFRDGTLILQTWEDESQTEAAPTFDLTPEVALSQAQLEGSARKTTESIQSDFSGTSTELQGKLESAKTQTQTALDALTGELNGEVGQAKTALDGALSGMGASAAQIGSTATEAMSELRAAAKL